MRLLPGLHPDPMHWSSLHYTNSEECRVPGRKSIALVVRLMAEHFL